MNKVDWGYFKKFESINNKYLPEEGEGETFASQIVTAINKLIYKWYNDGDVFDNTYALEGWANDLSDYANWLAKNVDGAKAILDRVYEAGEDEYELILKDLADEYLTEDFLASCEVEKIGSIYDCDGDYEFIEIETEFYDEE